MAKRATTIPRLIGAVGLTFLAGACAMGPESGGTAQTDRSVDSLLAMGYGESLGNFLGIEAGDWTWRWQVDGSPTAGGPAHLAVRGDTAGWRLGPADTGVLPLVGDSLSLLPEDPFAWHAMMAVVDPTPGRGPLPLPRQAVDSAAYADLLDLVQRLTTPRFRARVIAWRVWPVPVLAPPTPCGDLDLGACLRAAVDVWNDDPSGPSFSLVARSDTGISLVHVPDPELIPHMAVRWIAGDAFGHPVKLEIVVGAAWRDASDVPYVVRGFVHELAHTLLLWGHSEERQHTLWRCGPIVDRPAPDERRAARLWRLLPEGLDLTAYWRLVELDPQR